MANTLGFYSSVSPAVECVLLVAWFGVPVVDAVAGEQDGVDVDEGQEGDTDGDEDAGSAEVVGLRRLSRV